MSSQQVWLITGGARGLGKGLVATLLQRPNTTAIAAVRDISSANSNALFHLPRASNSDVIVVKIDSESDDDPATAVAELQSKYSIHHIDTVVANAYAPSPPGPVAAASIHDLRQSYQVNAFAPVLLFQATWPLLQKSAAPKFIGISSCVATIGKMADWTWPIGVYGSSKAAMNFLVRKMHFENERLVAFVLHPG